MIPGGRSRQKMGPRTAPDRPGAHDDGRPGPYRPEHAFAQWSRTWPATALTLGIGLFGAIAPGAVAAKPLRGADLTGTNWAVLGVPGGLGLLGLLVG